MPPLPRLAAACGAVLLVVSGGCSVVTNLDDLGGGGVDGGSGDASALDRGDAGPAWVDDFTRPDAPVVGNQWIMKTADAFHILGGEAERISTDGIAEYRDAIVYRPASEDLLDVAVSEEFRETALPPGYPQIEARIQQGTVTVPDTLDCYLFFIADDSTIAVLGRQRGNAYLTQLATINVSPAIDTTGRYRLMLSVKGQDPVSLAGEVDRWDTASSTWVSIGGATVSDADPARIATAGSVGFSGGTPESDGLYDYDNFTRAPL